MPRFKSEGCWRSVSKSKSIRSSKSKSSSTSTSNRLRSSGDATQQSTSKAPVQVPLPASAPEPAPRRILLSKGQWRIATGAKPKPRRLQLRPNQDDGIIYCPIESCTHTSGFTTVRGCRKHVGQLHSWYYYFDERPNENDVIPKAKLLQYQAAAESASSTISDDTTTTFTTGGRRRKGWRRARPSTRDMPSFSHSCSFAVAFVKWQTSDWGGGRTSLQAKQTASRILKYLRFSLPDAHPDWDIPSSAVECLTTSTQPLTEFIQHLQDEWHLGYSGIIGYLNAISEVMDYRRMQGGFQQSKEMLEIVELLLSRTRKALAKRRRLKWSSILNIENFKDKGCWASVEELQSVLPFHEERFSQIISNASLEPASEVGPHDLSFCTHYVATICFLDIKASRPMTYQFLTVQMIQSIKGDSGVIDQTVFKTSEQYGFDSLLFEANHLHVMRLYIDLIRPRLNPTCDYLMVTRKGNQMTGFSSILGNMVYSACGKYIHPTRLRQIIETESTKRLSRDQQTDITENQKHDSRVAKVHYQLERSQTVALRARAALEDIGITSQLSTANLPTPLMPAAGPSANSANSATSATSATSTSSASSASLPGPSSGQGQVHVGHDQEDVKIEESAESAESVSEPAPLRSLLGDSGKVQDICEKARCRRQPQRKTLFTMEEDLCLRNGVLKYGWGNWSKILSDPHYHFNEKRSSQTLHQRAKQKRMNQDD